MRQSNIILIYLLILSFSSLAFGQKIRIGTSSILEGNYMLGIELCKYIKTKNNVDCELVPTNGSFQSLQKMNDGSLDFALVQANFAVEAYNATGYFKDAKPNKNLKQVLTLYDSTFTIIVQDKDLLLDFADLDGRKISNGPPASDSSSTYTEIASLYNFKQHPIDVELSYDQYADKFCRGEIDAIILMTNHPSYLINHITHKCESDFMTLDNAKIDLLVKDNDSFKKVILPRAPYPGVDRSDVTIASPTILVARKDLNGEIISKFLSTFEQRVESFKASHPALNEYDLGHFLNTKYIPE